MAFEAAVRTSLGRARVTVLTWAGLLATTAVAAGASGQPWRAVVAVAVGLPLVVLSLTSLRALVGVMVRRSVGRTAATVAVGALSVAGWSVAVLVAALGTLALHLVDVAGRYGLVELVPIVALTVFALLVHAVARRIVHGEAWLSTGLTFVVVLVVLLPAAVARPTLLAMPAFVGGLIVLVQAQVWVPIALDAAFPDEDPVV